MRKSFTRRDFLKLTALGAAAAGIGSPVLTGLRIHSCQPIRTVATIWDGPDGVYPLLVEVQDGKIRSIGPNIAHPLTGDLTGSEIPDRQLDTWQTAPRPDGPLALLSSFHRQFVRLGWTDAVSRLAGMLEAYRSDEIAFLLGAFPDHLNHVTQMLARNLGGAAVLRCTPESLRDGRITLVDAARRLFGLARLPTFDLLGADLVFSFGRNGSEPWLNRHDLQRFKGSWVEFSPLPPAERPGLEWVCIRPGSEAWVAGFLAQAAADWKGGRPAGQNRSDLGAADRISGISPERLIELAERFVNARTALAVPGLLALAEANGAEAAFNVLLLNARIGRLGKPGGVYLPLYPPLYPHLPDRTATLSEVEAVFDRIRSRQIKLLLVHGFDPVASLPVGMDVEGAFERLEALVSFSPLADRTSRLAHLWLPDRLPLESWGYQQSLPAADRPLTSAVQPVLSPSSGSCSTVDVLLAAAGVIGGNTTAGLTFRSELDFIQHAVTRLDANPGVDRWRAWMDLGGWWDENPRMLPPVILPAQTASASLSTADLDTAQPGVFRVVPVLAQLPAAERPFVGYIHPDALAAAGLMADRPARVCTPEGEIRIWLRADARLSQDTLVLAYNHAGRVDLERDLFGSSRNAAGDLRWAGLEARLQEDIA